jgi:2-C-methyl-D-erythritol 4-phosphate cytidylyltransferase
MMKKYAVIVAGGKGLRMGGDLPKQFLPLQGKPVLMHTLEAFRAAEAELTLIVVLPVDQHDYWAEVCSRYPSMPAHLVAPGGETRFHSVRNGLQLIPADEESLVAVHDGVRPFVAAEVIHRCFETAVEQGAVVPVVPVVDTVRELLEAGESRTVSRDRYRLVQTPQTFRTSLLLKAYQQPYQTAYTDDASVVEALGAPVTLVEGNRENIKLTTPFDLLVAESILQARAR